MAINWRYVVQIGMVVLFLSLLFPTLSRANESSIDLLPAAHEVPAYSVEKKALEGHWLAIGDRHDGSSVFIPVELHASPPSCPGNVSCNDSDKIINLSWTPPTEALFLIRGLGVGSQRIAASVRPPCSLDKIGNHCSLEVGGIKFVLTAKGKPGLASTDPPLDFSIVLEQEKRFQVLWDFRRDGDPSIAWDDPHFSLEWAGDVDQDGKLDFIMTLTQKYTSLPTVLFLSSKANAGDLVKRVSEYTVED